MAFKTQRINVRMYWHALWYSLFEKLLLLAFIISFIFLFRYHSLVGLLWAVFGFTHLIVCRFFVCTRLLQLVSTQTHRKTRTRAYPRLIFSAFIRLLNGAVWGIPFAGLSLQLYRYIEVLPVTAWNKDFTSIGAALFKSAASQNQLYIGMFVFFGLLMLSLLLFIYGWRRGMVFEFFQINNLSIKGAYQHAKTVRKAARKSFLGAFWLHVIICLPAAVIPFLLPYFQLSPLLTGKVMNDLSLIAAYIKAGILSGKVLIEAGLLFLLLYLPFLPLRRLRIAKVVNQAWSI